MCGIWALFEKSKIDMSDLILSKFNNLKNRGPDRSVFYDLSNPFNMKFGFHRLAINDSSFIGDQPFVHHDTINNRTIYLLCNGEIYNDHYIINKYGLNPVSKSDCEVIMILYSMGWSLEQITNVLIGEYAFIIIDINNETNNYIVHMANDQFGVRPLFVYEDTNIIVLSSELKGIPLSTNDYNVNRFPSSHYATFNNRNFNIKYVKYFDVYDIQQNINDLDIAKKNIYDSFMSCVNDMVNTDKEIGCLLSGGLDSSLVSATAAKFLDKKGIKLRTFSIGLPESTDEYYANLVSKHINSNHTHITCTENEFINAVPDVVRMIESYDITTVRASVGQYLISKWISNNTDIKVLLCGDGSDELAGGYLYFHKAPNINAFDQECKRLMSNIHLYDGLRTDRCVAGHGLEARFPFLCSTFVKTYLSVDNELRLPRNNVEKWLLRESFSDKNLIPDSVLYRKKEAFSDGVSSKSKSWYQIMQNDIDNKMSNEEYNIYKSYITHLTPITKESMFYRSIFIDSFGKGNANNILKEFWMPKWSNTNDPSARTLDNYDLSNKS